MSKLRPLNIGAICPKCGGDETGVAYREPWAPGCRDCKGREKEHMDRWCKRCHYEWAEAVLARPAPDPAQPAGGE